MTPGNNSSRSRGAALAVLLAALTLMGACTDNCRTLSERLCSFLGNRFESYTQEQCLGQADEYFGKMTIAVRWENEYRCDQYLRSCTEQALAAGEAQECGLASAGLFSPCITNWKLACDCGIADPRTEADTKACHLAAEATYYKPEQDRECGSLSLGACSCEAIKAADCAACGFSPCGPFSPCIANWHKACDCVWGAYPEKLKRCHAQMDESPVTGAAANPYAYAASSPFSAGEDAACVSPSNHCTCEDLASGDCSGCGFGERNCGQFGACKLLAYRLCGCVPGTGAGANVCGKLFDLLPYTANDDSTCRAATGACDCPTIEDGLSCPGWISARFTPCWRLAYDLSGCETVPEDKQVDRLLAFGTPAFTPEQDEECRLTLDTCTCDSFVKQQGCPEFLFARNLE
jgi:hypothetical protein